jgi:hypothetical protein
MGLETLSPELVYATKGNIAYPSVGASPTVIADLAQRRYADSMPATMPYVLNGTTTLTTGLTSGVAATSLAVSALPVALASGQTLVLTWQGNTVTVTTSAAAAVGATSISISSTTPNFSFPVGSEVAIAGSIALPAGEIHVANQ